MKSRNIIWVFIGLIIGIVTGYLRGFSPNSFLTVSDIAGRYGFWIFTVAVIAYLSKNKKEALINSFLYMFFMCIFYYAFLYFKNGNFYYKQFILWTFFAIITSVYAKFINQEKEERLKYGYMIYCIPISLLGIEFMDLLNIFVQYHTNFFQLIIDLMGTITLTFLFAKNRGKKFLKRIIILSSGIVFCVCVLFIILWSI